VAFWFAQIKQQEDNLDKITNYIVLVTFYYYLLIRENLYQDIIILPVMFKEGLLWESFKGISELQKISLK